MHVGGCEWQDVAALRKGEKAMQASFGRTQAVSSALLISNTSQQHSRFLSDTITKFPNLAVAVPRPHRTTGVFLTNQPWVHISFRELCTVPI
jgi:hypothetical protein